MSRSTENKAFVCAHCGAAVLPLTNGSYRNHCPLCLHSLHVDEAPGDRASGCGGLMVPRGLIHHGGKGWQVVHRCVACGAERANKVAEFTVQPDRLDALLRLIASPARSSRMEI
ncbi:MAG: RNHCP domain-containing protein [bacterium]